MQTNTEKLNQETYKAAVRLLGREPRAPFSVKTFCPSGTPQVLIVNPVFLEDSIWKPFPTLLWLTCPRMKSLTGNLEQQGFVKEYTRRLNDDEAFRAAFLKGQKELAEIRVKLAEQIFGGELPAHIKEILSESSAAGSKDLFGVKCLHAHLAQELAFGNNPIGADVLAKIGACKASDNCGAIPENADCKGEQK